MHRYEHGARLDLTDRGPTGGSRDINDSLPAPPGIYETIVDDATHTAPAAASGNYDSVVSIQHCAVCVCVCVCVCVQSRTAAAPNAHTPMLVHVRTYAQGSGATAAIFRAGGLLFPIVVGRQHAIAAATAQAGAPSKHTNVLRAHLARHACCLAAQRDVEVKSVPRNLDMPDTTYADSVPRRGSDTSNV